MPQPPADDATFRMLAETTQSGIFICRDDGRFCYFNPTLQRSSEYSADELQSMSVLQLVHPDSRALVAGRMQARARGEQVPGRYQFRILTKSGETRWLDVAVQLIDYQGRPAIMGTGFDITDAKRSEQQAQEHTALLQTLIANSPYGILMGGKDHHIRFCNTAFQRIFQYTEDEIIGSDPDDLIGLPGNTQATDISQRVMRGEVVHHTAVRRRKDGSKVDVEFHAVPLMTGGEFSGCFGIYQDITGRMQSEAKLRALRDRLTRVQDEERAHFARELHDDIGQRLALLAIQLAQLQKDARTAAPSLEAQLESSRRLAEETCGDAQRISHRLHPSQLVLLGLTKALSNVCGALARQSRVTIDFIHDDDVPRLPPDIETCLYRVAQEAIQNATKHGLCDRIRVELSATAAAVRLCVSDAGQGFDPAAAEHSSGLGLVSMAERVRSAGGRLSIQTALNQGTRIDVAIPLPPPAV